jgi:hypothetical protein
MPSSGRASIDPRFALATFDSRARSRCSREVTIAANTTGLEIRASIPNR